MSVQPPAADGSEHANIEQQRLELEKERLTKHIVSPRNKEEWEKQEKKAAAVHPQVTEDAKIRASEEKKKHHPGVDFSKKDAPSHKLDQFELDYVVGVTHTKLTDAFNAGNFKEIGELFTRDGSIIGTGGAKFQGREDISGYFQRLAAGGTKNLKHTPGSAYQDGGFALNEHNGKYSSSSGAGTFSVVYRLFNGHWLIKTFSFHS